MLVAWDSQKTDGWGDIWVSHFSACQLQTEKHHLSPNLWLIFGETSAASRDFLNSRSGHLTPESHLILTPWPCLDLRNWPLTILHPDRVCLWPLSDSALWPHPALVLTMPSSDPRPCHLWPWPHSALSFTSNNLYFPHSNWFVPLPCYFSSSFELLYIYS